jgi:hypothetical protein
MELKGLRRLHAKRASRVRILVPVNTIVSLSLVRKDLPTTLVSLYQYLTLLLIERRCDDVLLAASVSAALTAHLSPTKRSVDDASQSLEIDVMSRYETRCCTQSVQNAVGPKNSSVGGNFGGTPQDTRE